jgi:hypothetical protein
MARKVLEGTWEEVSGQVERLPQHHIRHARLELELDGAVAESASIGALTPEPTPQPEQLSAEERIRILDEVAAKYADLPALPPEAFERDSLYEGHY